MGIQTIAEFVENDEIIATLRQLGVDYAQGYAVAKPQPMDELFSETGYQILQKAAEI
jgi:EAL domain-containing protein (putative c-di-GMP-specific phosphodiesterase class I)